MGALTSVILPVFLVIGAGYVAVWRGWFSDAGVDGLMVFTQRFAIPALLFAAIAGLDLTAHFRPALLVSFYAGALIGFAAGFAAGRFLFGRDWEDAIAFGFVALFSNTVLLGLPITERAYGTEALAGNFAIIALHAPICYGIGITLMEIVRARGTPARSLPGKVGRAMFSNALIIAIGAGFAVNVSGVPLPEIVSDAVDLLARAALPAALFGLGGVLVRYRPEGDMRAILTLCAISLGLHPVVTWGLALSFGLDTDALRSAVVTAAMAPGINVYVFANMYGRAKRVAASTVLIGTALSTLTAWVWLAILP